MLFLEVYLNDDFVTDATLSDRMLGMKPKSLIMKDGFLKKVDFRYFMRLKIAVGLSDIDYDVLLLARLRSESSPALMFML